MNKKAYIIPKATQVLMMGGNIICNSKDPVKHPGEEDNDYGMSPARKLYV